MKSFLCGCLLLSLLQLGQAAGRKRQYCDDTEIACPEFASRGECQTNPDWLNKICGKSCKFPTLIRDDVDMIHDICAPGWSDQGRDTFLHHLDMNANQSIATPGFTDTGFKVVKIPDDLYEKIQMEREEFLKKNKKVPAEQRLPGVVNNLVTYKAPGMITISKKLHREIVTNIKPMLEEWIGEQKLESTDTYGIRRYTTGHQFHMHVDVLAKYVVSALLHIADDTEHDWPLYLVDNTQNIQQVVLKPGDMLFYESAKVISGYPDAFIGSSYEDFFAHFRPYNWKFSHIPSGRIIPIRDEL